MRRKLLLIVSLLLIAVPVLSKEKERENETSFARRKEVYRFSLVASPLHNIEATAIDTTSVYQLLNLEFHRWKISNPDNYSAGLARFGAGAVRFLWHFHTMLQFIMWPHEGGHWIRHREFGNSFNLGPIKFSEFPRYVGANSTYKPGATNLEKMMGVIGGPETNHLIALHNQKEIYRTGTSFGDDMFFVTLHKLQYIFYLFVYTNFDNNLQSWRSGSPGDPQQYAEFFYRHYYGNGQHPVGMQNGVEVLDPRAKDFYNEMQYTSFFTLLDPFIWNSFYSIAKYMVAYEEETTPWWFHTGSFQWMYGAQTNISPVGYELYLHLYGKWADRFGVAYFRYGRPFTNYGGGMEFPDLFQRRKTTFGPGFDLWEQKDFDIGGSIHTTIDVALTKKFSLRGKVGWKNEGYLMGEPLAEAVYGFGGLSFSL